MNFKLLWSDGANISFEKIVICLFIGLMIAALMIVIDRMTVGGFVRRLLKKRIDSAEKAVTLKELGYGGKPLLRASLSRSSGTLRKFVFCTNTAIKLKRDDLKTARFYIPEEKSFAAGERYSKKNSSIIPVILFAVILFIVCMLVVKYYPIIVEKFNNIF